MGVAFTLKSPWVPFAASVSILVPLLVLPLVSWLTRKPSRETLELIFGAGPRGFFASRPGPFSRPAPLKPPPHPH